MVIDNNFRKKSSAGADSKDPPKEKNFSSYMLANPIDRLAAAIIDVSVILLPVFLLLSSPIKKVLMSSVLMQNELLFMMSLAGMGLVGVVTIISYQTLFVYFLGGTIGKKIFHLQVVNIWGEQRVSFSDAFFRSLIWGFESLVLFIPHLSVFSDSRRRPLHDRIANTMVINLKKKSVLPPSIFEVTFAKAILTSVLAVVLVIVFQQLILMGKALDESDYLTSLIGEGVELCEEVTWAMDTWPKSEQSELDVRVKIALALFAAGEATKDCLKQEVSYFQANNKGESSVAYLGQAFIHSADPERSNQYLHRICEVDPYSSSCAMAGIVENWSDSAWENVDLGFMSMGNHPQVHIAVWAIRHYTKQRQFERASSFLDTLSPQRALAGFLGLYRVKVLWGLQKRKEVRLIADIAMESLPQEDRLRISTWMCRREYYNEDCNAFQMGSCKVLDREVQESVQSLLDPDVALLTVLKSQCQGDHEEVKLLADTYMSLNMKKYLQAQEKKESDPRGAAKLLTELVDATDVGAQLHTQAKIELIDIKSKEIILKDLVEWKKDSPSETWGILGGALMGRLNRERLYKQAKDLGQIMYEEGFRDDFILKPLVVALYNLGSPEQAWGLAGVLKDRNPKVKTLTGGVTGGRIPASVKPSEVSEYEKIETSLSRKFSGR